MAMCMFLAQSGLKTIYTIYCSSFTTECRCCDWHCDWIIGPSTCSISGGHFAGCSEISEI